MKIGYARKSRQEMDVAHQVDALRKAGCEEIYQEQVSRGGKRRAESGAPELQSCLKALRQGDTLMVWALDRLGGSLSELLATMEDLQRRGIEFESLNEKIDTSTPAGEMYFHLVAVFSNFERNRIIERTKSGLAAAKARGRIGGRKPSLSTEQIREIDALIDSEAFTVAEIAKRYGVTRPTIYNRHKRTQEASKGVRNEQGHSGAKRLHSGNGGASVQSD